MAEPFEFRATINKKAILSIYHEENLLSQKKIEKSGQRSHFTHEGEKITWICEVVKRTGRRSVLHLYLYPININYTQNPLTVEEI